MFISIFSLPPSFSFFFLAFFPFFLSHSYFFFSLPPLYLSPCLYRSPILGHGPVLECCWYTNSIEENWLSLTQQCISKSSLTEAKLDVPHLFSMLLFCQDWACTSLIHAATISMRWYVHSTRIVWKILFPWSQPPPVALTIFLLPFHITSELWGEKYGIDIPFKAEYSKVFHSLHVNHLWSSVLISIYCKKKCLWWGLSDVKIYGHRNKPLWVLLLLCPFIRVSVSHLDTGSLTVSSLLWWRP